MKDVHELPEDSNSASSLDNRNEIEQDLKRQREPFGEEDPPRLPFPVVGIGASAGGLEACTEFFSAMSPDSGMSFVLIQHLPPDRHSMIADILSQHTRMKVQQVQDGMPVEENKVYVIRPGHTLTIKNGALHLEEALERPRHGRPVDDFFKSLAEEQRERAICIIMSGLGSNGTAGAQAIKAVGGICIAQDLESAQFPSMPRHLIDTGNADYVLTPREMPAVLIGYSQHPYAMERSDPDQILRNEYQHLREILEVLKTRTRHDFSGYKKPTVLRRIQRRMGLNRIMKVGEYAKLLRRNPAEVTSLSDDLLIHVTGFFRDPEAWESLRQHVIMPLIASRESGAPLRCWVAACSSGEEAYSLAILLQEECERANKILDIKVFATDMAERTLANARNGLYPGGIEAEVSSARLERFFNKEDAVYRVRPELRERVVFAPQNLLQDPPFSRLDIVSCRNLLIYLEPEMQHRVMNVLHFALRDGGALFLGTSETVPNGEQMFETIDKKARVFRRIGPSRPPNLAFPLRRSVGIPGVTGQTEFRSGQKPSVAAMTTKALLSWHVPAAITVDRDFQIMYFHGNTQPYLNQPSGEPTRELIPILKEEVRGAVRTALHRAMSENSTAVVHDGIMETNEGRVRIVVTASPMESMTRSEYFVVSFSPRREEHEPPPASPGTASEIDAELARVRRELQMTIEELQTSNEEHKASAEEVMSINEELQSSNEELQTSKEEMQSLNEELTTVNAQLQVKMEEFQSITSDLGSLLSSTDIAVLFLDTQFRIRRYTPAATKLLELIASDIGRPLSDLALKFTDPTLLKDAKAVMDSLQPNQKEVAGAQEKWYVRRILPYRTSENRIEGVVITFVDITEIKNVEAALRRSEDNLAAELTVMSKLHDITNRLIVVPTLTAAMDEILAAAVDITGADMGNLQLLDEETNTLNLAVHRGFKSDFLHQFKALSKNGTTACAVAFREGRRVVVEDVQQDPLYASLRSAAASAGFQAVQSTPLQNRQGRNIGVISTHFKNPFRPTNRALGAMDLLARQAADVIERIKTEDRLTELLRNERTAHTTLNEAARMKDEFLATLSHELRTPLSAILLWSKVIRDTPVGPDRQKEGVEAIIRNAEAQSRLIEDLVDTSRIATGKLRMEFEEIDLGSILMQSINSLEPTALAKGVNLVSDIAVDIGIVRADTERMQQVFWNLLTNAVKFTPDNGTVTVRAKRVFNSVEIRFSDTGIGIEPAFLPHVFDRFLQYDSSNSRKHMGLGLGLAITKQLIQLHGGTIEAQSSGPNRGSTFVVRLPMPAIEKLPPIRQNHHLASSKSLHGLRILLVEDDVSTQSAMEFVLTQMGAEVFVAESARLAMLKRNEFVPAVIISDIGLPDMDGHAFIKAIRELEKQEGRQQTISIAVSAFAREEDRLRALAAGFTQYFSKPLDLDKLIHSLISLSRGRTA